MPTPSAPEAISARPGAGRGAGRRIDRWVAALARLVLRVFFRRVEVVGAERLPRDRPLVLVANHVNGLVDPLLLWGPLAVHPRLLAKSTLWKNPFIRPWVELAGAIPVYRRQDLADTSKNVETFARSTEVLAAGGALALFPEGGSHHEPGLQPLKTGAARIVLDAEARHPGLGVRIVPVGLLFERKQKFRSRALVQVGVPIDPAAEAERHREDPAEAVRALTARVDKALKAVTLNYETWDEARLVAQAAEIYQHPAPELPGGGRLAESFPVQKAFREGYDELRRRFPERTAAVADAMRTYDRLLRTFNLRDDHVAASYPPALVMRFVLRTLLRLLVYLPVALVGTALNLVPYILVDLIAGIPKRADQTATYKVFSALILYPATWIAAGVLVADWAGEAGWGVAAALAGPFTGWVALRFHDRRVRFWREARAWFVLRTKKRLVKELKAQRSELLREVEELAELVRQAG